MKRVATLLCLFTMALLMAHGAMAQGSGNGQLTGTVLDPEGKTVVGAVVVVTDAATGAASPAVTTGEGGHFNVSNLPPGVYTISVTMSGFSTSVTNDVKITMGLTNDIRVKMELGKSEVKVIVEGGGIQVMETQDTAVSTVISGRPITDLPYASRSAVLMAVLDPGAQTVGGPRATTFEGLPKSAVNITFDGINNQDNLLKSSDGFFALNDPRIDDIEEFGITTNANDPSKNGEGAAQMNYVSKRGGNAFHGGVWEYNRNSAYNSNYYFNNFIVNPATGKGTPRTVDDLNDFGYKVGGPIFKDKLFFFTDFDFFFFPQSASRTRTILTPAAATGLFTYQAAAGTVSTATTTCTAAAVCTTNLLALATAQGMPNTISPVIGVPLGQLQSSLSVPGVTAVPNGFNNQNITFNNATKGVRKYPDIRLDYNINKHHSLEFDYHYAHYIATPDLLNTVDATYPVAPFNTSAGAQLSNRSLFALAERWTIGSNMSNEIRIGLSDAPTNFGNGINLAIYPTIGTNFGTTLYRPSFAGLGISSPFLSPGSIQGRNTVLGQLHEAFNWVHGPHSFSFGVDVTSIYANDFFNEANSVSFGISTAANVDPAGVAMFTGTVPGISSSDLSSIEAFYANLTGRVTSYAATQAFNPLTRQYQGLISGSDRVGKHELGLFAADSWRVRPNLTFNYGLRWEFDGAPFDKNNNNNFQVAGGTNALFGISGPGHLFQPGAASGSSSIFMQNDSQTNSWYNRYWKAFAPSVGLAWQPNFDNSMMKHVFGGAGKTVLRAGYAISYNREGLENFEEVAEANPGDSNSQSSIAAVANNPLLGQFQGGSVVLGTGTTLNNVLGSPGAIFQNNFQFNPAGGQQLFAIDPKLKPPMVQSWTAGIQRELTSGMVVEIRYQGNHGVGLWDLYNLNETNIFENGFLTEYQHAQSNLSLCTANQPACIAAEKDLGILAQTSTVSSGVLNYANVFAAANAACVANPAMPSCATSILPLSGDIALPVLTAAFNAGLTPATLAAATTSVSAQSNSSFRSSTFTNLLLNGGAGSFAGTVGTGTGPVTTGSLVNMINAGFPSNYFQVNPTATNGVFALSNAAQSTYNAAVIDLRKRPSHGLQFDMSYTFQKSLTDYNTNSQISNVSFTTLRNTKINKGPAPFDIRNAFKLQMLYDLPFGQGKRWSSSSNLVNRLIGGWSVDSITRWQTGPPIQISSGVTGTFNTGDPGVNLVGITRQQLQSMLTTNKAEGSGATAFVYYVPTSLLDANLQKANTAVIQPCNVAGTLCARPFVYGPQFFRADISLVKTTKITERVNFEMRMEALNAFNDADFFWGCGPSATGSNCTVSTQSTTFGKMGAGVGSAGAYSDLNTTQDPGGRILQLVGRINF